MTMKDATMPDLLSDILQPDGSLFDGMRYVDWSVGDPNVILDGEFDAESLHAIANHMQGNTRTKQPEGEAGEYYWKCNCCHGGFKSTQKDRTDDGSGNGGAKCPYCKADGQYTYRQHPTPSLESAVKGLEEAKVLIGAKNDTVSEVIKESNINAAWHLIDKAIEALTGKRSG